jgi:hypothetical protein
MREMVAGNPRDEASLSIALRVHGECHGSVDCHAISGICYERGGLFWLPLPVDPELLAADPSARTAAANAEDESTDPLSVPNIRERMLANIETYARGFCQLRMREGDNDRLSLMNAFQDYFVAFLQERGVWLSGNLLGEMRKLFCGPFLNVYAFREFLFSDTRSLSLFGEFNLPGAISTIKGLSDFGLLVGPREEEGGVAPLFDLDEVAFRHNFPQRDFASLKTAIGRRNEFVRAASAYLQSDLCFGLIKRIFTVTEDGNLTLVRGDITEAFANETNPLMFLATRMLFGNENFFRIRRTMTRAGSMANFDCVEGLSPDVFSIFSLFELNSVSNFLVADRERLPVRLVAEYLQYAYESFSVCEKFNEKMIFRLNKEKRERGEKATVFHIPAAVVPIAQLSDYKFVVRGGFFDRAEAVVRRLVPPSPQSYFGYRNPRFLREWQEIVSCFLVRDAVRLLPRDRMIFQQDRRFLNRLVEGRNVDANNRPILSEEGVRAILDRLIPLGGFCNNFSDSIVATFVDAVPDFFGNLNGGAGGFDAAAVIARANITSDKVFDLLYRVPMGRILLEGNSYFLPEVVADLDPLLHHIDGKMGRRISDDDLERMVKVVAPIAQGLSHCTFGIGEGAKIAKQAVVGFCIVDPLDKFTLAVRDSFTLGFRSFFRFFGGNIEFGESIMCFNRVRRLLEGKFGVPVCNGMQYLHADLLSNYLFRVTTEKFPLFIRDLYSFSLDESAAQFISRVGAGGSFAARIRVDGYLRGRNVLEVLLTKHSPANLVDDIYLSIISVIVKPENIFKLMSNRASFDEAAHHFAISLGFAGDGDWHKVVSSEDEELVLAADPLERDAKIRELHTKLVTRLVFDFMVKSNGYLVHK